MTAIRRTDKANPEDIEKRNPLAFGEMKIVPSVGEAVTAAPDARVELYVVIYPTPGISEQPKLVLELARGGTALGRGELELPKPDADGRIPYIATLPVGSLQPGDYEIRAIATQGSEAVQERTFVTISAKE